MKGILEIVTLNEKLKSSYIWDKKKIYFFLYLTKGVLYYNKHVFFTIICIESSTC